MGSEPLLNGRPLAEARAIEARGGANRRDDPLAAMPKTAMLLGGPRPLAGLLGQTQSNSLTSKPQRLGGDGTRLQTASPPERKLSSQRPSSIFGSISGQPSQPRSGLGMPNFMGENGFGPVSGKTGEALQRGLLGYRNWVRGLLMRVPFGFSRIGMALPALVLGATVWLPLTILGFALGALAHAVLPLDGPDYSNIIKLVTNGLTVLASGYFVLDRMAQNSDSDR